jgi:ketosteroid isomerase-like protein
VSHENVEIVRRAVAAAQRGDWPAVMEAYDREVELDQSRVVDGGVFHGHDGVSSFFRRWFGTWDELEITAQSFIDVDDDRVLVLVELMGKGKRSGVEVSLSADDVQTLRHDKIVQMTGYTDRAEALKAVGLEE